MKNKILFLLFFTFHCSIMSFNFPESEAAIVEIKEELLNYVADKQFKEMRTSYAELMSYTITTEDRNFLDQVFSQIPENERPLATFRCEVAYQKCDYVDDLNKQLSVNFHSFTQEELFEKVRDYAVQIQNKTTAADETKLFQLLYDLEIKNSIRYPIMEKAYQTRYDYFVDLSEAYFSDEKNRNHEAFWKLKDSVLSDNRDAASMSFKWLLSMKETESAQKMVKDLRSQIAEQNKKVPLSGDFVSDMFMLHHFE